MSNVKREIMNQKIKQYESSILKYLNRISENGNNFFYDMLNDFSVSLWFPILSDVIQHIHILFCTFKENVSYFLFLYIVWTYL